MTDTFYVKNNAKQLVAAKFLSHNGSYVADPNSSKAINAEIFDSDGNSISNANPNGYLIVPANYTIDNALAFANVVSTVLNTTVVEGDGIASSGGIGALGLMTWAFLPNGSQDLQRTYTGSTEVNPGDFVKAFTSAASFNLGLISTYSGIGEQPALEGGGLLNMFHKFKNSEIDTSGTDGNNPENVPSIDAGSAFAKQLINPQSSTSQGTSSSLGSISIDDASNTVGAAATQLADDIYPILASGDTAPSASARSALTASLEQQLNGLTGTFQIGHNQDGSIVATGSDGTVITLDSDLSGTKQVATDNAGSYVVSYFDSQGDVEDTLTSNVSSRTNEAGGATKTITQTITDDNGNLVSSGTEILQYNSSGVLTNDNIADSGGSQADYTINSDGSQTATVLNSTGQETEQVKVNADGSQTQLYYDPSTGTITTADIISASGSETDNYYNSSGQEIQQNLFALGSTIANTQIYFDPATGNETYQNNYNATGAITSQDNYNTSKQLISIEDYNSSGQEVQQNLFALGSTIANTQIYFDPATGNETYQNNYGTTGAITSQDNYNTSKQLISIENYNSTGQEIQQNLFALGSTIANTQIYFDPATGNETYQNNYGTTGAIISQDNYNTSNQLISIEDYNSSGQEVQKNLFALGSTIANTQIYFDPATGNETYQNNYNTLNQITSQDNYNTSKQLISIEDFNASGQEIQQNLFTPGLTFANTQIYFDPETGNETYQNNYNTLDQFTSQDNYNTSTQLISIEDFNSSGQEIQRNLFTAGSSTANTEIHFDPVTGNEAYQNNYNSAGQITSQDDYNAANQLTSEEKFTVAAQLISQTDFVGGKETEEDIYTPGATYANTQIYFEPNETESYKATFDSSGHETQTDYFNGDSTEEERAIFTPGNSHANTQYYYDGNGALNRQVNFNQDGQELSSLLYSPSGQETESILFNPGSNYAYQENFFSPGAAYSSEIVAFNQDTGYETADTNFNPATGKETSFSSVGGRDSVGSFSSSGVFLPGDFGNVLLSTEYNSDFDFDFGDSDFGGFGFAGDSKTVKTGVSQSISPVAQTDLKNGDQAGATAAQAALHQAYQTSIATPTSGTGSVVKEGASWGHDVVTWSLATPSNVLPFSGAMGAAYEAEVQQAFTAWGAASGIVFKEVADSSQTDIRLGWSHLGTASTGVAGYTSFQAQGGQIAPGVLIQLEDPSQDALVSAADGQSTYAGTGATLQQVLLHEIGHAIGLADDTDQNSVMYYDLGGNNRTLDGTDIAGIQALYGHGGASPAPSGQLPVDHQLGQLIQAMAAFNPQAAGNTTLQHDQPPLNHMVLAAAH